MKVLLTGANGFLGSHVLDDLLESGFEVAVLLRQTSDTRFIDRHSGVSVFYGSLSDSAALAKAMEGVDAAVHCAGKTKALRDHEYFDVNRDGTSRVVDAASSCRPALRRFVLVSSLAAAGPGVVDRPARETDPPQPVSLYGRSKLAGEETVKRLGSVPWTILRPGAIYGPRDMDFLNAFRMVRRGLAPTPGSGKQMISFVFVRDVAVAVRECLTRGESAGKIYNVAAEPPCSTSDLLRAVARVMKKRVRTFAVPAPVLYVACVVQDGLSRLTRRPHILGRQKWPEFRAAGWVCSVDRIREDLGFSAGTSLEAGLAETAGWYMKQGWL
jgi:nucleoside-diphosphate-sugar epimerase